MTLNVGLLIKGDATSAKQAVRELATEQQKLKAGTGELSRAQQQQAAQVDYLTQRNAALETKLAAVATGQTRVADTTAKIGVVSGTAAGSVGNLAANFNDVFVMMAAGQNPMQLAIQQGTQIGQVFGGKGIGGALGMVKAGFLQMVSPVNLATIGIIAFGGAAFQWLTGTAEKARTVAETIDDMEAAVDSFRAASDRTKLSVGGMFAEFGTASPGLQAALRDLAAIEKIKAYESLQQTSQAMRDLVLDVAFYANATGAGAAQDFLGLGNMTSSARELGEQFRANLETLRETEEPSVRLQAALDLRTQMTDALGGYNAMNEEQRELFSGLTQIIFQMEILGVKSTSAAEAAARIKGEAGGILGLMISIGQANISAPFARAEVFANRLYARTGDLLGRMMRMAQQAAAVGGGRGIGRQGPELDPYGFRAQLAADAATADTPGTGGGTVGGGGGGAARAERDAVAELIAKLREEAAVLAELDPVKQQMLKYREQLSTATAAERAEVEALIMVREREKAIDQLGEFGGNSVVDLLKTIGREGETANDVFKKIIRNLADMGIQALILGKGPLAQLFGISGNIFQGGGGGGGGNIFGQLIGSIFGGQRRASGGMIFGDGGGRDDRVPVLMSAGEFAVNARATARHRPLLERINAGLPRFADGGMIGGGAAGAGGAGGAPHLTQIINVNGATGNSEIADMVRQGVEIGVENFSRAFLPQRVLEVQRQPRRRNF